MGSAYIVTLQLQQAQSELSALQRVQRAAASEITTLRGRITTLENDLSQAQQQARRLTTEKVNLQSSLCREEGKVLRVTKALEDTNKELGQVKARHDNFATQVGGHSLSVCVQVCVQVDIGQAEQSSSFSHLHNFWDRSSSCDGFAVAWQLASERAANEDLQLSKAALNTTVSK